jgi:hypothetical protein
VYKFNETKRQRYERQKAQMEAERSSFLPSWRETGEYLLPRRPRFLSSDVNRGDRRNQKIIDSTGTVAVRNLKSGMMSGITSPARPWFRLTTPDPDMAEFASVKRWLDIVTRAMQTAFMRCGVYQSLPTTYGDMGVFATAALGVEEDFDKIARFTSFPIGSYAISNNDKLQVDAFTRDLRMTVRQLVKKFGQTDEKSGRPMWEHFSDFVKQEFDRGNYETWVDVCHIITPNMEWNPEALSAKHTKPYASCYYEKGTVQGSQHSNYMEQHQDRFLRESGYDYFPVLVPRWEVTGEDVWGTNCPGFECIGDVKQLQLGEKRSAEAIEKKVKPPMVAPVSLMNMKTSILPGDITYADEREGMKGFRPAHEVNLSIVELEEKQAQVRRRIQRVCFEDLFLMLANDTRSNITAREIEERHEEKLLALGPVLEQLNQDLLDPMIDIMFAIMITQGHIPEPPKEIQGVPLKVEYISVMAQAQKLVGISSSERFLSIASQILALDPESRHKINFTQFIDVYGDQISLQPGIIRTDDEVAEMQEQVAKAQQAQQRMELLSQGATAARDLSAANLEGDNALARILDNAQAGQMVEGA